MAGIVLNQTVVPIIKVGLGGNDFDLKSSTVLMRTVMCDETTQKIENINNEKLSI